MTSVKCEHASAPRWPIFVISLFDATARREAISAQLSSLNLKFEVVDAIDGRAGLPAELERMVDRPGTIVSYGRPMSDGEYACALSHLSVYERIIADDLPGAVVLEDDAIVGADFARFIHDRSYSYAPLIQLDHYHARTPRFGWTTQDAETTLLKRLARNAFLCSGYTISREGAEFILARALPLRLPADWPCDLRSLGPYCADPRLVDHPKGEADISSLRDEREAHNQNRKHTQFRRFKYQTKAYWEKRWLKLWTKRLS